MPSIATATMPAPRKIRVVLDAAAVADASQIDPTKWTVTALDGGTAVTVASILPDKDPPTSFDVTTDDHTDAKNYRVAIAGVVGVANSQADYVSKSDVPFLTSAVFVALTTLRLTFSETMTLDAALTTGASYDVVEEADTSVRLGVERIEPQPGTTKPLWVDVFLTGTIPGRKYRVRIPA